MPVLPVVRRITPAQASAQPENMVYIPGGEKQGTENAQVHAAGKQRHLHQKPRQASPAVQKNCSARTANPPHQGPPGAAAGHLQAQCLDGRVGVQLGGLGILADIQKELLLGTDKLPAIFGVEGLLGGKRLGGDCVQPTALQPGRSQPVAHSAGCAPAEPGQRPAQLLHKQPFGGHVGQPALAGLHLIARAGHQTVYGLPVEQFHPGPLLSSDGRGR